MLTSAGIECRSIFRDSGRCKHIWATCWRRRSATFLSTATADSRWYWRTAGDTPTPPHQPECRSRLLTFEPNAHDENDGPAGAGLPTGKSTGGRDRPAPAAVPTIRAGCLARNGRSGMGGSGASKVRSKIALTGVGGRARSMGRLSLPASIAAETIAVPHACRVWKSRFHRGTGRRQSTLRVRLGYYRTAAGTIISPRHIGEDRSPACVLLKSAFEAGAWQRSRLSRDRCVG